MAETLYVCAIETKHLEDWRLFRSEEAAQKHREAVAQKAWDDAHRGDEPEEDFDVVDWFICRDSTYLATVQELTLEEEEAIS